MGLRTTSGQVQAVLVNDYDGKTNLNPFIRPASRITDRVQTLAKQRNMALTTDELLEVETWLAAHFYCQSDQPLSQKTTEGASGTFQGKTSDGGIAGTKYGQMAIRLDWSGSLNAIDKRAIAKGFWIGVYPTDLPPDGGDYGNAVVDPGPGQGPY